MIMPKLCSFLLLLASSPIASVPVPETTPKPAVGTGTTVSPKITLATTAEASSPSSAIASPQHSSAEIRKKEEKKDSHVEKVVGIAAAVAAVVSAVFGALASIVTTRMTTKSAELLAVRLKINEARTPAYKSLWAITGEISKELYDQISLLRTSLMEDLQVYSEKEARTPLLNEVKPGYRKTPSEDQRDIHI
jgi:hypothetical protein